MSSPTLYIVNGETRGYRVAVLTRSGAPLMEKRSLVEREIAEKRQLLTAQLLDELSTVTGTAIDIPIDRSE